MIFATVGTQLAFDRMMRVLDEWAESADERVVAQIGPSDLEPEFMQWSQFLPPDEFQKNVAEATLIVSHAGMGSILTAMRMQRPIVIMPRRADYHEHRNDHQLATAVRFQEVDGVYVAMNGDELADILNYRTLTMPGACLGADASDELIATIRDFIRETG